MKKMLAVIAVLVMAGCADPNGLHNQKQSLVTFELINFPLADGDYCVSGDWQGTDWDNSRTNITLKDHKGVSTEQTIKSNSVKFTVVPVGTWGRPWYPATTGNAPDETQNNIRWNFEVQGIPSDTELTITVDGGRKPAEISWK